MIEAGCRALHEMQGSGDADAPMRSSYQNSWDKPDSVRWRQWEETVAGDEEGGEVGVFAAMLSASSCPVSLEEIVGVLEPFADAANILDDALSLVKTGRQAQFHEDCQKARSLLHRLKGEANG
jgi:hypothetical protein